MDSPILQLRRYIFWLLLFVCLPGITPCHARDDAVSEQTFLQEFPVVLSASRLSQPLSDAPNAVTVIDRTMIKASGFRTIADLFKLVPGMYVDYVYGYTPFISYHGATDEFSRRMQVLVDGRSVYLPPFNAVDWEDLPLHIDDIERIEVVRGPAATSYGSNSILGVINIITLDASALNGPSVSMARGNVGNAGISDAVARFGKNGEYLDYRVTFGKRSDSGFMYLPNTPNWYNRQNDSSTTHFVNLRGNYHPTMEDSFDFQAGFSNGVRSAGDTQRVTQQPRTLTTDSGYQQLNWLHTLGNGDDIHLRYYHMDRSLIDEGMTAPHFLGLRHFIVDDTYAHSQELEFQHTLLTGTQNRLVWGAATRYESVDASSQFLAPQSLHQSRWFAHDEWHILPRLVLNAGAMYEDDGMGHRNTSPRAALNYHLTPEHTFRADVSVAYRNPALFEERGSQRYYYPTPGLDPIGKDQKFLAYGGLRPERTLSREVGYLGKFSNGLSVDVRMYNEQMNDIIWLDYVMDLTSVFRMFPTSFRNEFAAQYTGLEGVVKYSWGEARDSFTLNYAHQNVSCYPIGTPYLASNPNPAISAAALGFFADNVQAYAKTVPVNSGSLLYTGQMGDGISFSAGYYQQGAVTVIDAIGPQPLTRRVDMRMAKRFWPSQASGKLEGGEVALVMQNVFNNSIVGYSNYFFIRRAYLTATINF